MIASARARARGERAHSIERCTNEFLDPKNPHLDTKVIKIGQQEGARGFVQFFSILAQCAAERPEAKVPVPSRHLGAGLGLEG